MDARELAWRVDSAVRLAESGQSALPQAVFDIEGMSSPKIRRLLNHLGAFPSRRYLEVGCWQGSTLVSFLHGNAATVDAALAIDDFSEFGAPKARLWRNMADFLEPVAAKLRFVEADCWRHAPHVAGRFNTYLYDGAHEEADQYKAFACFDHALDDTFVAMVDDWNHPPAPAGTRRAFAELGYRVEKEWELPARYNGDRDNWWNGFYVAVVTKPPQR